jgi:fumarylpyruvate hydrolase
MMFTVPQVTLPIKGTTERLPVRNVYCVGRNYNDHVVEMGGVVGREPPFFFMKPATALVTDGRFPYPPASQDVHYELGPNARIFGHAVGIDMTRRDLQAAAKKAGRPWETAKAFAHSGPIGRITPGPMTGSRMSLSIDGAVKQQGDVAQMIWSVAEILVEFAKMFDPGAGDLIFTGTPAGVGPVKRGDKMHAEIEGLEPLEVAVV